MQQELEATRKKFAGLKSRPRSRSLRPRGRSSRGSKVGQGAGARGHQEEVYEAQKSAKGALKPKPLAATQQVLEATRKRLLALNLASRQRCRSRTVSASVAGMPGGDAGDGPAQRRDHAAGGESAEGGGLEGHQPESQRAQHRPEGNAGGGENEVRRQGGGALVHAGVEREGGGEVREGSGGEGGEAAPVGEVAGREGGGADEHEGADEHGEGRVQESEGGARLCRGGAGARGEDQQAPAPLPRQV
eukprot:1178302-Prorocentrum_minimum.AAC.3